MTDHPLADGPFFAWHRTGTEQNDITSPAAQKHRDGNKWLEYRKKGDNIQTDRQQSQQSIKPPSVRSIRHHKEEHQGVRRQTSRCVNMELPPIGTGSRGKTIKMFAYKLLHYFHYLVHTQQVLTACLFHLL